MLWLGPRSVRNCPELILGPFLTSLGAGFLDLCTVGIWSQLTLFREMFSSIPGLCLQGTPLLFSCDNEKCLQI